MEILVYQMEVNPVSSWSTVHWKVGQSQAINFPNIIETGQFSILWMQRTFRTCIQAITQNSWLYRHLFQDKYLAIRSERVDKASLVTLSLNSLWFNRYKLKLTIALINIKNAPLTKMSRALLSSRANSLSQTLWNLCLSSSDHIMLDHWLYVLKRDRQSHYLLARRLRLSTNHRMRKGISLNSEGYLPNSYIWVNLRSIVGWVVFPLQQLMVLGKSAALNLIVFQRLSVKKKSRGFKNASSRWMKNNTNKYRSCTFMNFEDLLRLWTGLLVAIQCYDWFKLRYINFKDQTSSQWVLVCFLLTIPMS